MAYQPTVTVDNAAGAAAVNIQDGGNTITVDGSVNTTETRGATGVITSETPVAALNSGNQQLLATDSTRLGVMILNGTNRDIYIAFGQNANTTTSYSVRVATNGLYEVPQKFAALVINFSITNNSATGAVLVTKVN